MSIELKKMLVAVEERCGVAVIALELPAVRMSCKMDQIAATSCTSGTPICWRRSYQPMCK